MAERTNISWADYTFNPYIGCTRVSNGPKGACVNCYAAKLVEGRMAHMGARFGGPGQGVGTRVRTSEAYWRRPLAWNRKAAREGTRPFVFCASLADVFDNEVDPAWRRDLFDLIRATPNLVWLLLTKRIGNAVKMCASAGGLPPNAALGSTVVTQEEANRDVPGLLHAAEWLGALFAFVSMEPLMEPVSLDDLRFIWNGALVSLNALTGRYSAGPHPIGGMRRKPLAWVITGGESGPNARPSHRDWFRSLRDQCAAAGVPFDFKQWGSWLAEGQGVFRWDSITVEQLIAGAKAGKVVEWNDDDGSHQFGSWSVRLDKHAAGDMLDGVVQHERPTVRA